jgi:LmeA-like phospholipid-binding
VGRARESVENATGGWPAAGLELPGWAVADSGGDEGGGDDQSGGPGDGDGGDGGPAGPVPRPRRGRRGRVRWRLLILALAPLVVLSVIDRVAAHEAGALMVNQIQKSEHLPNKPEASVGGVPFLTQIAFGRYRDISFGIRRIAVSDLCVDDISLRLNGVHVPLRAALSKKVKTVPIDRVAGSVRITYADLNTYLATRPGHVQVTPAGTAMRISAPVDIPVVGPVTVFGEVRASVENNQLTIAPAGLGVGGLGALPVPSAAARVLTVTVPLRGLPMNLRLISAKATSTGLEMTAEADHLKLDATQNSSSVQLRAC